MTMKKTLLKTTLGIALGLCAFAVPGYSSTILQFGKGTAGNGTMVGSVGNLDVGVLTLNVNGLTSTWTFGAGGFLHFNFDTSANTFTLSTTGGGANLPAAPSPNAAGGGSLQNLAGNVALFSASTNLAITTNSVNPPNYTFGGGGTINPAANSGTTFLADLGLLTTTTFTISGGVNGLSNGVISSDTITLTATPEPSTVILFATGLIAVAGFGRKRLFGCV